MALDKVVDSAILDADLLSVANAIRGKFGVSDTLDFPNGFISAIENGLGVYVVAYANETLLYADTPEDNTVGVITDVEITSWVFSDYEPSEPINGMVWFTTNVNGPTTPLNTVKENTIEVYPVVAKQYIDNSWSIKRSVTYKNGVWTPWASIIHYIGLTNTELTGGLEAYAYRPSTSSGSSLKAPTVTQNADSISLSLADGYAGMYCTVKPIDMTKYSKMKIDVTALKVGSSSSYVRIATTQTLENGYTVSAAFTLTGIGISELDVSSLEGPHYVFINLYTNSAKSVTFTRWWLE